MHCFTDQKLEQARPITVVTPPDYNDWLNKQSDVVKQWLNTTDTKAEVGTVRIIPDAKANVSSVLVLLDSYTNFWGIGDLPLTIPTGNYYFEDNPKIKLEHFALGWGLGAYQFTNYKQPLREAAKLVLAPELKNQVKEKLSSLYLVRDLINMPADDMGPSQLSSAAAKIAKECGAEFSEIVGEDLLKQNYAAIYTVGRACDDAPRLLDIRWGNPSHPKLTLVGKGVCFDTGGLDIKTSKFMLLMKKDMGGGAHVLGLARMIMQEKLPVRLRVLIPAVENSVSGNSYRAGDIIKGRSGKTIEIGNTDAEGRVVLSDALTEAVSENPELIIDIATLTGAARVALGTELPAMFANNDALAQALIDNGIKEVDPVWRLPLFMPYREYLNSLIADINNDSSDVYGGAISAALFLKDFVPDIIPWVHFDISAWNYRPRPGKPIGGEAMAIRALFKYIKEKFK